MLAGGGGGMASRKMKCDTTDPVLLAAVRNTNDEDAWGQFDALYRPRVVAHCRQCGLTSDQADEVAQECFVKCFRYLPSFEYQAAIGQFRAWLNMQVNQQIAELFRRSVRTERVKQAYAGLIRSFASSQGEPNTYDYELAGMTFRRAQAEVQPKQWQIFEAFLIHGMSCKEVAEQFHVGAIAVRVISHRVKGVLRRHWREVQNGPF